jgi:hypothetical protein
MLGHRLEPSDLTVLFPQPCMPKDIVYQTLTHLFPAGLLLG